MRRAAAVGLMGLALVALPVSARSETTAKTIAEIAAAGVSMGLVCWGVARAADDNTGEDEFARRGWLVGVAGSYAIDSFKDLSSDHRLDSLGVNGRVGYRCHRRFSVEEEVEWLDGFDADLEAVGDNPLVITTNVKGYLLTGRYQPFLLVGAGAVTADGRELDDWGEVSKGGTENAFAMRFGVGIDLYATKHVVVNVGADYVRPFGKLDDLDYISIGWGFQYRF